MSRENAQYLESLEENERLDYAYQLVIGTDAVAKDLSAGMFVLKRMANEGKAKAQFLLYEYYIPTAKMQTGLEWLRKAYLQGYGPALAMGFFEFYRENIRWLNVDTAHDILKKAVALNVPAAHYFMGKVYEQGLHTYNISERKAAEHFKKADELGFHESQLDKYEQPAPPISYADMRRIFQSLVLPDLFLNRTEQFYEALDQEGERINALIKSAWECVCEVYRKAPENYPLDFQIQYVTLDEAENNATHMMVLEAPRCKRNSKIHPAILAGIIFGVDTDIRYFMGEPGLSLLRQEGIFVVEMQIEPEEYFQRINYGFLYQGCNNEPFLLNEPINPRSINHYLPVAKEEQLEAFVDTVAKIYFFEKENDSQKL